MNVNFIKMDKGADKWLHYINLLGMNFINPYEKMYTKINYKDIKAEHLEVQKSEFIGVIVSKKDEKQVEPVVKKRGRKPKVQAIVDPYNYNTGYTVVKVLNVGEYTRSDSRNYLKIKPGDLVILYVYNTHKTSNVLDSDNKDEIIINANIFDIVAKIKQ